MTRWICGSYWDDGDCNRESHGREAELLTLGRCFRFDVSSLKLACAGKGQDPKLGKPRCGRVGQGTSPASHGEAEDANELASPQGGSLDYVPQVPALALRVILYTISGPVVNPKTSKVCVCGLRAGEAWAVRSGNGWCAVPVKHSSHEPCEAQPTSLVRRGAKSHGFVFNRCSKRSASELSDGIMVSYSLSNCCS